MPWVLKTKAEPKANPEEIAAAQAELDEGIVFSD